MSTIEEIEFVGSQGATLSARLHRPEGRATGSILLAHCFTCSKDLHTMTRLASGLAEAGLAAMRFDFTGLGESGGDFADTTLSANVSDLTRAAASLINRGFGPCGLIGHSLGGAAAVLATQRLKTVRSLVTIGAPADASHVRHLLEAEWSALAAGESANVTVAGRRFRLNPAFVHDLSTHDVAGRAALLGRPYCVVHARDDTIVGFDNAEALYRSAGPPKKLAALDTGGHLFGDRDDAEKLLAVVRDWFTETL
ncbi:MAG: alpha/beta hydrolase [Actinomycetota bacterium]